MTTIDPPLYTHDCPRCVSLGRYIHPWTRDVFDLYVHLRDGHIKTVIARYGNEAWAYASGLGSTLDELAEAERRALAAGHSYTADHRKRLIHNKTHVGATVWWFDDNRMKYRDDEARTPIWRYHWIQLMVGAQTPKFWLLYHPSALMGGLVDMKRPVVKVDKVALFEGRYKNRLALSTADLDDLEWLAVHRQKMIDMIRECQEPKRLAEIAKVLNYESVKDELT